METNKAAATMADSDGASDCSHFSIITPPSPASMSSCAECCSQDKAQQKDSDDSPVANDNKRTKDKKPLPTKSQRLQAEAPEPCIHSLAEKSEHLSSKLTEVELALEWFKIDVASKSANENNSSFRDAVRAGHPDLEIELQRETMAAFLKTKYQHLWEEVARLLSQAMFENENSLPPGQPKIVLLADQKWCLELVKNAFITSIIDGTKRDAAASMLATPTLAFSFDGVTDLPLPPSDGKKKKKKGYKPWQPEPCIDPFTHPGVYGMPPMEPYPGPPEPYTGTQPMQYPPPPMQYPPPPNPEVYGMPPANRYPGPPDPFGQVHPTPYTPIPYSPPPQPSPPPMNPEDYPHPHDPFAGIPPLPFSRRRRSIDSRSSSSVDWREKQPKPKSKFRSRLHVNKFEVRWWLRTALSFSEVLCMIVVIVAVFRAPGLLGELVDVVNPRNKDRCLGFRVRR
jgi:hypothetical protein